MPRKQNLQPLLDVRQHHLALLFGTSDATDAVALGTMGFSAAALIFGLESALKNPWWLWALLLFFFIASIVAAIMAVWPRNLSGASVDIDKYPEYLNLPEDQLVLQLLADTQESIEINRSIVANKTDYCTVAILLAIIGLEALLACIIKL
jgi:hypothetical protein